MTNKIFKVIEIVFIIALILSAFLVVYTALSGRSGLDEEDDLFKVNFIGTYQTSDMDKPEEYNSDVNLQADKVASVVFQGHFDADIEADVSVMMRCYYLTATLYLNGEKVDFVGTKDKYPSYMNSVGSGWAVVKSPTIMKTDDVEIVLNRNYDNIRSYAYTKFINNIYKGNSVALLQKMITQEGYVMAIGGVMLVLGLVFLIALILMKILKLSSQDYVIWLAVLMISGGVWMSVDYNIISLIIPKTYVLNLLEFTNQNLMLISVVFYIKHFLNEKTAIVGKLCLTIQTIFFVVFLVTQICGIADGYQLNNPFAVMTVIITIVILATVLYQYKAEPKAEIKFMGISISMLFIGGLIDISNYLLDYSSVFIGMQLGLGAFVAMHGVKSILLMRDAYKAAEEVNILEKQLMENSMNVMVSQIQPHFMFNCLTAIQQLCVMDPDLAEEAVSNFASFLRVNIDTLRSTKLVPFDKELIHIKHYIRLEQMRFEDRVNVIYNIEKSDFMIPSLAVQPLVENAVRYGITKQVEGGTITISTKAVMDKIIITVEDDGVGFDINEKKDDGKKHLGIVTVRERLESQCKGSLTVESEKGKGTKITMVIPKLH